MSHEKTITVGMGKKFYNIPSVVEGRQVSDAQAVKHFRKKGRHFGSFSKLQGALFSAGKRSRYGHGRERPLLKRARTWDARFLSHGIRQKRRSKTRRR